MKKPASRVEAGNDAEKQPLREQIHRAFDAVEIPTEIEEMLLAAYRGGDDAYELATVLVGKPWAEVPILDLFRHREGLATLSARAYRAYLPAYLIACLATEDPYDKYGADLQFYLVSSLSARRHQDATRVATTPERLSLLDVDQRAAVRSVLEYLEKRWWMKDAGEVLGDW